MIWRWFISESSQASYDEVLAVCCALENVYGKECSTTHLVSLLFNSESFPAPKPIPNQQDGELVSSIDLMNSHQSACKDISLCFSLKVSQDESMQRNMTVILYDSDYAYPGLYISFHPSLSHTDTYNYKLLAGMMTVGIDMKNKHVVSPLMCVS